MLIMSLISLGTIQYYYSVKLTNLLIIGSLTQQKLYNRD